jgi:hypothetical protein
MTNREGFLKRGESTLQKWQELRLADYPSCSEGELIDELVPFYGTAQLGKFSTTEKRALEQEFIKLNAELLIFLESLFSDTFKKAISKEPLSHKTLKAVEHLIDEEEAHSKAFWDFLKIEGFDKNLILLNDKKLLNAFNQLVVWSPLCCLITGAKSESYSIGYAQHLRRLMPINANRWSKLHHFHMIDEAHHVPFQFDVYEEALEQQSLLSEMKTFLCTFAFIILMQWVMIKSSWILLRNSLKDRSLVERIGLTYKLITWMLFDYRPMKDSRKHVQNILKSKNLRFGPVLRLVYR